MNKSKERIVRKRFTDEHDQIFKVFEIDGVVYEESIDIVAKIEGGDDEYE